MPLRDFFQHLQQRTIPATPCFGLVGAGPMPACFFDPAGAARPQ
jgi:hypothetical protein